VRRLDAVRATRQLPVGIPIARQSADGAGGAAAERLRRTVLLLLLLLLLRTFPLFVFTHGSFRQARFQEAGLGV